LVGVTQSKRVTPEKAGEAVCRKKKRGRTALRSSEQFPALVRGGVPHPLTELIDAHGIGSVHGIGHDSGSHHSNDEYGDGEKAF